MFLLAFIYASSVALNIQNLFGLPQGEERVHETVASAEIEATPMEVDRSHTDDIERTTIASDPVFVSCFSLFPFMMFQEMNLLLGLLKLSHLSAQVF